MGRRRTRRGRTKRERDAVKILGMLAIATVIWAVFVIGGVLGQIRDALKELKAAPPDREEGGLRE